MNTSHTTIPNKPPVEVIEAMIEASLANKHNVEAVYKAVIDYFKDKHIAMAKDFKGDRIVRIGIGTCEASAEGIDCVTVEIELGGDLKHATGLVPPETAVALSKSLFEAAVKAMGM